LRGFHSEGTGPELMPLHRFGVSGEGESEDGMSDEGPHGP